MGEREKSLEGFKFANDFSLGKERLSWSLIFGGNGERRKKIHVGRGINVPLLSVKKRGLSVPLFNLRGHFMTKKNKKVKCGPMIKQ